MDYSTMPNVEVQRLSIGLWGYTMLKLCAGYKVIIIFKFGKPLSPKPQLSLMAPKAVRSAKATGSGLH